MQLHVTSEQTGIGKMTVIRSVCSLFSIGTNSGEELHFLRVEHANMPYKQEAVLIKKKGFDVHAGMTLMPSHTQVKHFVDYN